MINKAVFCSFQKKFLKKLQNHFELTQKKSPIQNARRAS